MIKIHPLLSISGVCIMLSACTTPEPATSDTLINTAHLDHLYEEVSIGDAVLGTVWIYCEAPDYHLVGDSDEGFTCVDDVSRALVFYCLQYRKTPSPEILHKVRSMTEFLLYMWSDNGFFYNFLLPGPKINKTHQNSQAIPNWWSWRAFWALSEVNKLDSAGLTDLKARILPVMDLLVQRMQQLCRAPADPVIFDGVGVPGCLVDLGADQVGVMMTGLANYYQMNPSEEIKSLLLAFGNLLLEVQHGDADTWPYYAIMSWRNQWDAWGNSQAYALLFTGRVLEHEPFIQAGLNEVRYFYPYCLEKGFFSGFKVVKDADSLGMQDFQQFSQIAYNVRPMIFASLEAYSITGDSTFAATASQLATWFSGNNPANQPMYDPESGRTFDGIGSSTDVNRNSGAESTIEALLSLQAIETASERRLKK
ncbi:MAG: hypothetical protein IPJ40_05440 [Saprospirales bacterium]|nr:hypothetical protein [Saprospirales bacterium]